MAGIGYGSTVGVENLNNMLGSAAVERRDAARSATDLWSAITALGADQTAQVAALAAMSGWKDAANDPQAFWTAANRLYADAQFYYGTLPSPSSFNYDDALKGVRAGQ
jgi:hypothetical protein